MAMNALSRRFAGLAFNKAGSKLTINNAPHSMISLNGTNGLLPPFARSISSFKPLSEYLHDVRRFSSYSAGQLSKSGFAPVMSAEDGRSSLSGRENLTEKKCDVSIFKGKLKPRIVARRLATLKTYLGTEKNIRHSPRKLNLICQLVAGLPLLEALKQLEFCDKGFAPLVKNVLARTSNLADIRDGIQQCQLEVAECFVTQGSHLRRMKYHGKGRMGIMHHKYSHMRVILREIDFPLKIYQAPSLNKKRKLVKMQIEARQEYLAAKKDRDELNALKEEAMARREASK
jgi:large subunit ribosomal protein L22